jgi:hypothetical protein
LFVRHVKNIAVSNLMFGSTDPDPRTPVIAVDVKNIRIGKGTYSGSSSSGSFILMDNVEISDIQDPLGWKK